MIKEQLLPALSLLAAFYAVYRFYKWQRGLPEQRAAQNYNELCSGVHTVEQIALQIEELEEIITDLHASSNEALKGVTLSMPAALKKREYMFLTNGSDYSAKQLLNLAYSERDRKRELLTRAIADLHNSGKLSGNYYYCSPEETAAEAESKADKEK